MIKSILKKNGFTLSDFAQKISISRPTLNSYIKMFEEKQDIPNEKYQIIFSILFGEEDISTEKFQENLNSLNYLIERDNLLGTINLEARKTDMLSTVIEACKDDLYKEDCDLSIHKFIPLMINSYRSNLVLNNLVKYFLYLNGVLDVSNISDSEKIALSNYYKVFKSEIENNLTVDEEYLNLFYNRIDELKSERDKKQQEIKKHLAELVKNEVEALIQQGVSIDNIDTSETVKQILKKL